MPPPSILRLFRARSINSLLPQSTEPMGALKPLDKQKPTESAPRVSSTAGIPNATAALKIRAPSRWTFRPWRCANCTALSIYSGVRTAPPQRFCVFSRQSRVVSGKWILVLSRIVFSISPRANCPSSSFGTVRITTPPKAAAPPTSYQKIWDSLPKIISLPCCVWIRTAIRLLIVPLAVKRAASLPIFCAAMTSRRLTVGSSPKTSSPTAASNIACRMASVGWVTVSLRRSIILIFEPPDHVAEKVRAFMKKLLFGCNIKNKSLCISPSLRD